MDFSEALKLLKDKRRLKLRRDVWEWDKYVLLIKQDMIDYPHQFFVFWDNNTNLHQLWNPQVQDLLAEDWKISEA